MSWATRDTHHAHCPEHDIVAEHPGLLAKTVQVLRLTHPPALGEGRQEVLHDAGTQPREEDDEAHDQIQVIASVAVLSRDAVTVGQGEELDGVRLGFRDEVCKEQQGDKIASET